jgi:hypothetical protein
LIIDCPDFAIFDLYFMGWAGIVSVFAIPNSVGMSHEQDLVAPGAYDIEKSFQPLTTINSARDFQEAIEHAICGAQRYLEKASQDVYVIVAIISFQ